MKRGRKKEGGQEGGRRKASGRGVGTQREGNK